MKRSLRSKTCQPCYYRNRSRPLLECFEDRTLLSGGLDLAWSADGKVTTDFGYDDRATGVAVQEDGKIVAVGYDDGGLPDFAIARYNANGNLDVSFNQTGTPTSHNGNGKLSFTFSSGGGFGGDEKAAAVALQSDGKIVVTGYSDAGGNEDFAVARIRANGTLDTDFSGDGKRLIDFGATERATAVAIQPDGKIILAGYVSLLGSDFALVRLNSNGTLDSSFNGDGKLSFTIGGPFGEDRATAVAIQQDGKIVVAGYTDGSGVGANDFAIARITSNGELDTTFSGDGKQTIDYGYDDQATGVVIQPDGKIVVGGFDDGLLPDFAVARLNPNGSLDATFNSTTTPTSYNGNGKLSFTFALGGGFGGDEKAHAIALQPGGKIVVAGWTDEVAIGIPNNFAVARINPNGTLDKAFSGDGKVSIPISGDDIINAVALQHDGNIVLAGHTDGTGVGANDFAIARLIGPNVQYMAIGGAPGRVQVYERDGTSLGSFFPYAEYSEGVAVALADVNSDGIDDLITAATIGNPHTKVYNGAAIQSGSLFTNPESHILAQGFPYAVNFNVGSNVAAGDVNGDGYADLITGAVPGNPHVRVFDGKQIVATHLIPTGTDVSVLAEGFAYGINFNVGANVAAGDVNGDGYEDVITGATAGNPHTRVYDAQAILAGKIIPTDSNASELAQFFPYALQFNVGAFVSAGDYDRDGYADVITGASIGNPEVRVYSGKDIAHETFDPTGSLVDFYFAYETNQNIGVSVAGVDLTADGKFDVVLGTRNGTSRHRGFKSNVPNTASLLFNVDDNDFSGGLYVAA